jgi:hypothetical protein
MGPMLPVSLDCPFLIALSVFSNVYLSCVPYVASFSGLRLVLWVHKTKKNKYTTQLIMDNPMNLTT